MKRLLQPAQTAARRSRQMHGQMHAAPIESLSNFFIDAHPIGVGGHATVYWGKHRTADQAVAIKVMSPYSGRGTSKPGELSNCIANETRVFDQLIATGELHPNVVDVVTQFVSPGTDAKGLGISMPSAAYENPLHFFVTEFLGGGSLADAIRYKNSTNSKFEASEVLNVALVVSGGLRFLHAHGVAHRDVKSENLIYSTSRKDLKLIDFSLAAVTSLSIDDISEAFLGNVGTDGFVAPEVLRGGGTRYGPKCDIFSLGCVLHEMLAGEAPAVELTEDSAKVITCIPETVSLATRRFIDSMLQVDPKLRPTAAEIYDVCSNLDSQWSQRESRS